MDSKAEPDEQRISVRPRTSPPLLVSFVAGDEGAWRIDSIHSVRGDGLSMAPRLKVIEQVDVLRGGNAGWVLRGVTSNTRYASRKEFTTMSARQEGLNRPTATRAALIPIRKSSAWWSLAQDERRALFEEQSHHIAIGLDYMPAVARRLHHSRELGESFDFLTWFEYAPEHSDEFEMLVRRLRATPEWGFVDREVDVRLSRV